MKLNITKGLILIGAIALSSCSTQNKLASAKVDAGDDVYASKATAGDQPVYAERVNNYQHDSYASSNNNGDDYYNYDSYTARLNRFYDSPFALSYYDNLYYGGLSPYYTGIGLGLGLGYGSGYLGYSPFGYGYSPFYSYTPYSPYGYGSIYGYGAYPYGGLYSYYNTSNVGSTYYGARPYRGPGVVSNAYGANGSNPVYTRPVRGVSVTTPAPNNGNTIQQVRPQPTYQPQPVQQNYPSGNSGGGSSGGGARPVRP